MAPCLGWKRALVSVPLRDHEWGHRSGVMWGLMKERMSAIQSVRVKERERVPLRAHSWVPRSAREKALKWALR